MLDTLVASFCPERPAGSSAPSILAAMTRCSLARWPSPDVPSSCRSVCHLAADAIAEAPRAVSAREVDDHAANKTDRGRTDQHVRKNEGKCQKPPAMNQGKSGWRRCSHDQVADEVAEV